MGFIFWLFIGRNEQLAWKTTAEDKVPGRFLSIKNVLNITQHEMLLKFYKNVSVIV